MLGDPVVALPPEAEVVLVPLFCELHGFLVLPMALLGLRQLRLEPLPGKVHPRVEEEDRLLGLERVVEHEEAVALALPRVLAADHIAGDEGLIQIVCIMLSILVCGGKRGVAAEDELPVEGAGRIRLADRPCAEARPCAEDRLPVLVRLVVVGVPREVEGPKARVVARERRDARLVLAEEDLAAVLGVEVHLAQLRVLDVHPPVRSLHLRLLGRIAPGPSVAEERLRHQVQLRLLRAAVDGRDAHQDVVLAFAAAVLHEDVEVPVLVEDPCVHQLVLLVQVAEAGVDPADLVVGEDLLGVLVQHLEVAVRRRGVEVVVHILDVLAVVPLRPAEPEDALLQDRVRAVPQAEG
mmetsp:Transcript_3531/g.9487  ORF Transcript_3531/g.9487 Transcript_3531/m.9487 type:complete len:351 (-) Transcript_3531:434-1486(-)